MTKQLLFLALAVAIGGSLKAQSVGIGTSSPLARLHVVDSNVVFSATGDVPAVPGTTSVTGSGRRMVWYPDKAAFRAGYIGGQGWDAGFIGNYSFAAGRNNLGIGVATTALGNSNNAGGNYSVAMGNNCITNGIASVALGEDNFVNGQNAVAIGKGLTASTSYSVAIGYFSKTTGDNSTALGEFCEAAANRATAIGTSARATGEYSTSLGYLSQATGDGSLALGSVTAASGLYSIALGNSGLASGPFSMSLGYRAFTNNHSYSICIGASGSSNAYPSVANEHDNEFMVFAEYYRLWTSTSGTSVFLTPGSNSWLSSCDKNRKENFEPLDGEDVLRKIAGISFSSWNYKNQDPKQFRHYGIMAQDFYKAFGKDSYGTIGSDTVVNPIDMIGIDMTAIQALEKRTAPIPVLQDRLNALEKENQAVKARLEAMEARLNKLEKQISQQ